MNKEQFEKVVFWTIAGIFAVIVLSCDIWSLCNLYKL